MGLSFKLGSQGLVFGKVFVVAIYLEKQALVLEEDLLKGVGGPA